MNNEILKKHLIRDEDLKLQLYKDSLGIWSIGVGHNIQERGLSKAACMFILDEDIAVMEHDLDTSFPWWRQLDEVRQLVLANMCFNMGITVFSEFRNTLKAAHEGRYIDAAEGMKHSIWAGQVGARADRLIRMMQTGELI